MLSFCCCRQPKEILSTQLSPVKKRVKEGTPPLALRDDFTAHPGGGSFVGEDTPLLQVTEWSTASSSSSSRQLPASHTLLPPSSASSASEQQQIPHQPFIIIRDSPSPVRSIITISSESEDDESGGPRTGRSDRHHKQRHYHHLPHHLSDRFLEVKNFSREGSNAATSSRGKRCVWVLNF